uniref:C2H2-type domain-containing protein n=1 Tax=Heterorhabditis bacteriophora TaxID=37862 RepID=A0A1I7WPE3_HETBA
MPTREEEEKPRIFSCDSDRTETEGQRSTSSIEMNSSAIRRPEPVTPNNSPLSYKCAQCLFEQDGLSLMLNHLRSIHNVYPYECRCGASFENIDIALNHSNSQSTCTSNDLVVNITPIYNKKKVRYLFSIFFKIRVKSFQIYLYRIFSCIFLNTSIFQ